MPGDVFTVQDVRAAISLLEKVQGKSDYYEVHLHPSQLASYLLSMELMRSSTRTKILAWAIFKHEERRLRLGRRADYPTASECLERARCAAKG